MVDALLGRGHQSHSQFPPRFGGSTVLGLATLGLRSCEKLEEADASHGWCASLMIHHPHYVSQFPEEAQKAVWADGLDQAIAASIQPVGKIEPAEGGYRVPLVTFVCERHQPQPLAHCRRTAAHRRASRRRILSWFGQANTKWPSPGSTSATRGTGSNTAICEEDVFVPDSFTVRLSDLREGRAPGGALHGHAIYRAPFIAYAPLTFVTPMLGAAQGAYELFRDWTKGRRASRGGAVAEFVSVQVRLARVAADLDAVELLLRRAVDVAQAPKPPSLAIRARSMRDFSRAAELCVSAIDELLGHERDGRLWLIPPDPASLARHPFRVHARGVERREEFFSFRPART